MVASVTGALGAAGYSWAPQGKDRDGDGNITREEFKMPVMEGYGGLVPADLRASGSMDDAFDAYDHNKDGKIDAKELASTAMPKRYPADRFTNNWSDSMTTQQALAYFNVVNADNARLVEQWGLKL